MRSARATFWMVCLLAAAAFVCLATDECAGFITRPYEVRCP